MIFSLHARSDKINQDDLIGLDFTATLSLVCTLSHLDRYRVLFTLACHKSLTVLDVAERSESESELDLQNFVLVPPPTTTTICCRNNDNTRLRLPEPEP